MALILKMLILTTYLLDMNKGCFTKPPIDHLTDNSVERLKVSSAKRLLYNIIYKSNPRNANFDYLPFDGDERLIARRRLYHINDDFVSMFINGLSI